MAALILSTLLDNPATYLTWGWVSISVPNLTVILLMLALFILAIFLPFPAGEELKDER